MLKKFEAPEMPAEICYQCKHCARYGCLEMFCFGCTDAGICTYGITEVTNDACPKFERRITRFMDDNATVDGLLRDIAERLAIIDTMSQDEVTRNIEYRKFEKIRKRLRKKYNAGELDDLYKDDSL